MAAKVRHRPDRAAVPDLGVLDQTVVADLNSVTDARIRDPTSRVDRASVTDLCLALDRHVWMDYRVASDLCGFADIDIFRIDEADTVVEHEAHHGAAIQKTLEIGELGTIVDAFDLVSVA